MAGSPRSGPVRLGCESRWSARDCGGRGERSYLICLFVENAGHDSGHVGPLCRFGLELAHASTGERIEAGAAIVFRLAPLAFDPAAMLQTIDGGVEGALQDFQALVGDLLGAQQDAIAVQWTERDRLEDKHLE